MLSYKKSAAGTHAFTRPVLFWRNLMKKLLVSGDIKKTYFDRDGTCLGRRDVTWFIADTTDQMLAVHRAEKVNLVILRDDLPGMPCEELCSRIRKAPELRAVSLIVLARNAPADLQRASRYGANEIMPFPAETAAMLGKVRQLLNISSRESYRVLLSIKVEGSSNNKTFFCSSQNISTSGVLIETDRMLAVGDRVGCSFFLPESKQIKTTGEIVRLMPRTADGKGFRYGVKFAVITAEAKIAIDAFIAKKTQMAGRTP